MIFSDENRPEPSLVFPFDSISREKHARDFAAAQDNLIWLSFLALAAILLFDFPAHLSILI